MPLTKKSNFIKIIIIFFIVISITTYMLTKEDSGWVKSEPGSMFTLSTEYEGKQYEGVNSLTVSIVNLNVIQFLLVRFSSNDYEKIISPSVKNSGTDSGMSDSVSNAYLATKNFLKSPYNAKSFNPSNLNVTDITMESVPAKGSSAGLAYALSLVNTTNYANINTNIKVATTGAITPEGTVTSVGGVDFKVELAVSNYVDLILIPGTGEEYANEDSMVIPVSSLEYAIKILCTYKYYTNC